MHEIAVPDNKLDFPLILPWPPSVNTCWRRVGNKTLLSEKSRKYKKLVAQLNMVWKRKPLKGRLFISIHLFPPDKRRRDIDNVNKILIDSLQEARLFLDDSQIDMLLIEKKEPKKGGEVHVYIKEI